MNSVTFKAIMGRGCLWLVGWNDWPLAIRSPTRPLFRWPGFYEVTLRISRKWGVFRIAGRDCDGLYWIEEWAGDRWAYYSMSCISELAKLPVGVPFNVHTEWLRKATPAELTR